MAEGRSAKAAGAALRALLYALFGVGGMVVFAWLLSMLDGYLMASTLSVFLAAAIANTLSMRIFERAGLADIGLVWNAASVRNLLVGLAGGTGAACVLLVLPLVVRIAEFEAVPGGEAPWRSLLFATVVLIFGAAGEEMLFRGYGFQILLDHLGPFATILPVSVLFAVAHAQNLNVSPLGLFNTMLWGVLLGWSFLRSGDLWLPMGLHVGWNWALSLFGVNLSGFTIRITGYAMRWKVGPFWSGGEYGSEGGILTTAVLAGLAIYLWKAPIRRQKAFLLRSLRED
jgi:hypothetical protein